jgi:serpin B
MILTAACATGNVEGSNGDLDSAGKADASASQAGTSGTGCAEGDLGQTLSGYSFRLAREMLRDGEPNRVLSPLSAALSIGLSYPGASGETAAAIERTFGLDGWCRESVLALLGRLFEDGQLAVPGINLKLANAIFAAEGLSLEPAFVEQNQRISRAPIQRARFGTGDAREAIDRFLGEATGGAIRELGEDAYAADLQLLLLNAVSFEGRWAVGFDRHLTRQGSFYVSEDRTVPATLMSANGTFSMVYADNLQAVSLPYGDGRLAMTILLPYETDLTPALAALDEEAFASLLGRMTPQDGAVVMPRFSLTSEQSLKGALSRIGLENAFSAQADFRGISRAGGLSISEVEQKAHLSVSEDGTRAASATSTELKYGLFSVNHPFVFVIHETATRKPLFVGKITRPDAL